VTRKLLPYLQLCRLPAVFSALADICTGYLLTHVAFEPVVPFALLLVASSGLYLGGMVFNDVFDREIDGRERPGRPIPSGRVPLQTAIRLGTILMVAGVAAAAFVGVPSLLVALLLVVSIFAYDGLLKGTPLGPVVMGSCRFLNVLLGASAVGSFAEVWQLPQLHVAAGLGVYIMGVTIFARQEAEISQAWRLAYGIGVINLGFAMLVAFMLNLEGRQTDQTAILALGVIAITINRRLFTALFERTPARVQSAVKTMLLSHVMLNAALILHVSGSPVYTFAVIGLLVPAFLLGRWMAIT